MTARAVVRERPLLPLQLVVDVASAIGVEPPPVILLGLDKRGRVVGGGRMRFRNYHHYITGRKV